MLKIPPLTPALFFFTSFWKLWHALRMWDTSWASCLRPKIIKALLWLTSTVWVGAPGVRLELMSSAGGREGGGESRGLIQEMRRGGQSLSRRLGEARAVPGVRSLLLRNGSTEQEWGVWVCRADTWVNAGRQISLLLLSKPEVLWKWLGFTILQWEHEKMDDSQMDK